MAHSTGPALFFGTEVVKQAQHGPQTGMRRRVRVRSFLRHSDYDDGDACVQGHAGA